MSRSMDCGSETVCEQSEMSEATGAARGLFDVDVDAALRNSPWRIAVLSECFDVEEQRWLSLNTWRMAGVADDGALMVDPHDPLFFGGDGAPVLAATPAVCAKLFSRDTLTDGDVSPLNFWQQLRFWPETIRLNQVHEAPLVQPVHAGGERGMPPDAAFATRTFFQQQVARAYHCASAASWCTLGELKRARYETALRAEYRDFAKTMKRVRQHAHSYGVSDTLQGREHVRLVYWLYWPAALARFNEPEALGAPRIPAGHVTIHSDVQQDGAVTPCAQVCDNESQQNEQEENQEESGECSDSSESESDSESESESSETSESSTSASGIGSDDDSTSSSSYSYEELSRSSVSSSSYSYEQSSRSSSSSSSYSYEDESSNSKDCDPYTALASATTAVDDDSADSCQSMPALVASSASDETSADDVEQTHRVFDNQLDAPQVIERCRSAPPTQGGAPLLEISFEDMCHFERRDAETARDPQQSLEDALLDAEFDQLLRSLQPADESEPSDLSDDAVQSMLVHGVLHGTFVVVGESDAHRAAFCQWLAEHRAQPIDWSTRDTINVDNADEQRQIAQRAVFEIDGRPIPLDRCLRVVRDVERSLTALPLVRVSETRMATSLLARFLRQETSATALIDVRRNLDCFAPLLGEPVSAIVLTPSAALADVAYAVQWMAERLQFDAQQTADTMREWKLSTCTPDSILATFGPNDAVLVPTSANQSNGANFFKPVLLKNVLQSQE